MGGQKEEGTAVCPLHARCHVHQVGGVGESQGHGMAGSCSAVYQLEESRREVVPGSLRCSLAPGQLPVG